MKTGKNPQAAKHRDAMRRHRIRNKQVGRIELRLGWGSHGERNLLEAVLEILREPTRNPQIANAVSTLAPGPALPHEPYVCVNSADNEQCDSKSTSNSKSEPATKQYDGSGDKRFGMFSDIFTS
ncbi:MAG: hypothetical protein JNN22_10110 [Rhodospirillales bacterium]|nr:hypothetical protein [Rhodospirillales bacterium]